MRYTGQVIHIRYLCSFSHILESVFKFIIYKRKLTNKDLNFIM